MSKERDALAARVEKAVNDRRKAYAARDKADDERVSAYIACDNADNERRWARGALAEYDRQQVKGDE